MKKENQELEGQFYNECARLLGVAYTYKPWPYEYRGPDRWNNRSPGNGRFPGIGTVRMYGPTSIHISLRDPALNKTCKSPEEAYQILTSWKKTTTSK
jgi:hypothetical protein